MWGDHLGRDQSKNEGIATNFLLYRCILGKSDNNIIILDEDSTISTLYQYMLFIKSNKSQFRIKQKSSLHWIEAMLPKLLPFLSNSPELCDKIYLSQYYFYPLNWTIEGPCVRKATSSFLLINIMIYFYLID